MTLLSELKRRNVFRVGAAYIVVSWLLLQVADVLLGNFGAPDWVFQSFAALLVLGLPLALFLAWAFELTPEGVKRTDQVDSKASVTPTTGRRLDRLIIIALAGVIVLLAAERIWWAGSSVEPGAAAGEIEKSIAVLPFSDFSPGGDNAWFANGLSEEILNSLVRVPDLQVASRTSSFNYRASTLAISKIADELGVAHVLEGSVRMGGDRVRVTAQLIRASDGFHVWSNTFDSDTADMIGIQEQLALKIAEAMKTTMDPEALADMAEVGTRSVEAYQAYIRGRAIQEFGGNTEAYNLFEQARELDPGFAAAHFQAARYWKVQSEITRTDRSDLDLSANETMRRFNERIDAAIRSATGPTDALLYRGVDAFLQLRLNEATQLLEAYIEQRPGDFGVWSELGQLASISSNHEIFKRSIQFYADRAQMDPVSAVAYAAEAFRVKNSSEATENALGLLERWPREPFLLYQTHRALLWDGRIEDARALHDRPLAPGLDQPYPDLLRLRQACAENRVGDAESIMQRLDTDSNNESIRWLARQIMNQPERAHDILVPVEREGKIFALAAFMTYPHFDARRFPSLERLLEREGIDRPEPRRVPFACQSPDNPETSS